MSKTFADKLTRIKCSRKHWKRNRFANKHYTYEQLENLPFIEKIYNGSSNYKPISYRFLRKFLLSNLNKNWDTTYKYLCSKLKEPKLKYSIKEHLHGEVAFLKPNNTLTNNWYNPSYVVDTQGNLTSRKMWEFEWVKPFKGNHTPNSSTQSALASRIYKRPLQQRIELVKEDLYLIQYKSVWYLANPGDLLKESLRARLHTWLYDQCDLRDNDWIAYRVIKQLNKKDLKKYREKGLIT